MEIEKTTDGAALNIAVIGRIDTTAPQLKAAMQSSLDGVTQRNLDFAEAAYISSAGLRVLLSAQKVMNRQGRMVITNVNEEVMEVFRVTGFADILTIV